ncbi:MAG: M24 family metallopeptidase, partial [Acidobacteria bacterium]|nr:M24 family metallopeptidase [Acidobacteriota bacterium]NIM61300.1 M24 family metallopeptidase [Acidobacteriota bacterium]NIO58768.1 M24 family metallopeptidase [Acidobacteriota bacterium]NIQ29811.1 M24 family metallopeptidase [Acidobacteriota bacterium]NIQ84534.1 M24 family metallopeptidase [Acidobacteriota bacterium]
MQRFSIGLFVLLCVLPAGAADHADQGRVLDSMPAVEQHRERVETINRNLAERLDDLLPRLMRETGIDLWLVINREYAEDPVYLTLVPEPVFAARRTTMLVFHDRGEDGVKRMTVSRYPMRDFYEPVWEGGDLDAQWKRLGELLAELDPEKIGINVSRHWPLADGLTASLRDRLMETLTPELRERTQSAEDLVIRWMETRSAGEMQVYPHVVALARRVIAEAFSEDVITPGVTTTDDVAWYIRQRFEDLRLNPWFQPYVNVQRKGTVYERDTSFFGESGVVIQRGDVLHTDVGICYLRLCTDTQEMGYVLRLGESGVPEGLRDALSAGNRWQDILTGEFKTGRRGNEILARAIRVAEEEGIVHSIYTHPLGFFGHAAGPTIGMWDNQGPTPVRGDWKLFPDTGYAIEGNIRARVPEWDDQW